MQEYLYNHKLLIDFAIEVLSKAGLKKERAAVVAETLVEADLMGHSTHGLQLLEPYARELEKGAMSATGHPEVINDAGAAIAWNGRFLPGPYLVHQAVDLALERANKHPVVSVSIQQSHHIGCLAAYPEKATKQGLMMILACSDPRNQTVAPFGGVQGVYSPNPLAVGIPTETGPIIFDVSMSATANGAVMRAKAEGKKLPHKWMLDETGDLTDDPERFFKDPPATLLPLGSLDLGYKGFALGILIEALTGALGGSGRASAPDRWGASVFLQIINPDAFGGEEYFRKEMQFLADACLHTRVRPGHPPVRLPGNRALALKQKQMKEGVALYPGIIPLLRKLGNEYKVQMPGSVERKS